jgi:hypothetical protein
LLLAAFALYRIIDGDRSWLAGVIEAIVVIAFGVMVSSYFVHLRRGLSRLQRMKTPEAVLALGADTFKVISDVGSSEIKWSLVKRVWRFKNVWLLMFTGSEFMTLPTERLSEQSKTFITERAKANGAKIA